MQAWREGTIVSQACSRVVPPGLHLSREEWEDSPFCKDEGSASREELRSSLRPPVICWPSLDRAFDLLSRLAGWLPDSDCAAWDFRDLWRNAFPSRRLQAPSLDAIAALTGAMLTDPAKTHRVALALGQAVCRLAAEGRLAGLQQNLEQESDLDSSRWLGAATFLDQVPELPGVYWMHDREGRIFYVGQSGNLKRRLRSYFAPARSWDPKMHRIHARLDRIEFRPVGNALQAVLEEARAIARWKPEINTQVEVREREPEFYREADWILLLPESPSGMRLYFIKRGLYCGDFRYSRRSQMEKLRDRIERLFFSPFSPPERWETHVVQSFIRQNGERMNHIDVLQARDAAECALWIERYRQEGLADITVFRS